MSEAANPFQGFFQNPVYLEFKNHLYNYRLRKSAIQKVLRQRSHRNLLEIGSGVSPMAESWPDVIFSDITAEGVGYLLHEGIARKAMVADITAIPLSDHSVDGIVCSEVLEHVQDDRDGMREMIRVLQPGGQLVLTVPANAWLFAYDDRFVHHFRRYEIPELKAYLLQSGLEQVESVRIAGLIEKVTMISAVIGFQLFGRLLSRRKGKEPSGILKALLPVYKGLDGVWSLLIRLEAFILPEKLCSIVLVTGRKKHE